MDTVVLTYVVDELGEPQHEPNEVELSLCRKECRVRAIRIDAALGGGSQDARDARVRTARSRRGSRSTAAPRARDRNRAAGRRSTAGRSTASRPYRPPR